MPRYLAATRWESSVSEPSHLLRLRTIHSSYGCDSTTPFSGVAGITVTMRPLFSLTADNTGVSELRSKIRPIFAESEYPDGETRIAADSAGTAPRMTRTPLETGSTE